MVGGLNGEYSKVARYEEQLALIERKEQKPSFEKHTRKMKLSAEKQFVEEFQ